MEITYNENKTVRSIINSKFTNREYKEYLCPICGNWNVEDGVVWVNPETGEATTGDSGMPYCVGCAPEEDYELEDYDDEN
jgi:hypothetical protein